jgi:hypothetical protein
MRQRDALRRRTGVMAGRYSVLVQLRERLSDGCFDQPWRTLPKWGDADGNDQDLREWESDDCRGIE